MMFGESVTHIRKVLIGRNAHGQPIYEDQVQPPIYGASLQGIDTTEPNDAMSFRVTTDMILYVPPNTAVLALDKMTVRGKTYEVQGEAVGQVSAYTGTRAHLPVKLKRITG